MSPVRQRGSNKQFQATCLLQVSHMHECKYRSFHCRTNHSMETFFRGSSRAMEVDISISPTTCPALYHLPLSAGCGAAARERVHEESIVDDNRLA